MGSVWDFFDFCEAQSEGKIYKSKSKVIVEPAMGEKWFEHCEQAKKRFQLIFRGKISEKNTKVSNRRKKQKEKLVDEKT